MGECHFTSATGRQLYPNEIYVLIALQANTTASISFRLSRQHNNKRRTSDSKPLLCRLLASAITSRPTRPTTGLELLRTIPRLQMPELEGTRGMKSEQMVSVRRYGLYYHLLMSRPNHGTGSWFLILGPCKKKVSPLHDVGVYGCRQHHQHSVVFLGLLVNFLTNGSKWLHW